MRPGFVLPVFAVVLLVLFAGLWAALDQVHTAGADRRTQHDARASAQLLAQATVLPAVAGSDLDTDLDPAAAASLAASVSAAVDEGRLISLRLRSLDSRVIFPSQGTVSGARTTDARATAAVRATLAGEPPVGLVRATVPFSQGGGLAQALEVWAPVTTADGREVAVVQVALPYEAVAAQVEEDRRQFARVLGAGLLLLYGLAAVLALLVTGALRRQLRITDHLAHHDPLTGLPNRTLFLRRSRTALRRRGPRPVALAIVDLDRFKQVNDSLGHATGDEILREVGRRLVAAVRAEDTVARLGGDEFGLVLPGLDAAGAAPLLERVRGALSVPATVDGRSLPVAGSIGLASAPEHGSTVEVLVRHADVAMYTAKRSGRGLVAATGDADPGGPDGLERLLMTTELAAALREDQLVLHYQPLMDLADGTVRRYEALVRWRHPVRGLVPPDAFLPLAEQTGLVHPLTRWVLDRATRDAHALPSGAGVAVNVSPSTLAEPDFCDVVADALATSGLAPSRLTLEMTETALVDDVDRVATVLATLRTMGVGLSLDDFGQGSTSLSFLQRLPFTEVKIDRAFVAALSGAGSPAPTVGTASLERTIVAAVIGIAHCAAMRVVAEGVETAEVLELVRALGADTAQGWHVGRPAPMPAAEPREPSARVRASAPRVEH